jgi:uncharacterized protein YdeI (BOF family)
MKKKFITIAIASVVAIVNIQAQPPKVPANKGDKFGNTATAGKAMDVKELVSSLETKESAEVTVKGKVTEVCAKEGCWIKISSEKGPILVKMKDHAFLVPLVLNGKEVVINGKAVVKTTSVKELQHYAEDAGKSIEEIAAIKEPKKQIQIQAVGIEVLN